MKSLHQEKNCSVKLLVVMKRGCKYHFKYKLTFDDALRVWHYWSEKYVRQVEEGKVVGCCVTILHKKRVITRTVKGD